MSSYFCQKNLKIEADVVVSECTVCYSVVAHEILHDYMYFYSFISGVF